MLLTTVGKASNGGGCARESSVVGPFPRYSPLFDGCLVTGWSLRKPQGIVHRQSESLDNHRLDADVLVCT